MFSQFKNVFPLALLISYTSYVSSIQTKLVGEPEKEIVNDKYPKGSELENSINSSCETSHHSIFVGEPQKEIIIDKYFNSSELEQLIKSLGEEYAAIVKVRDLNLGKSGSDRESIWAVQISRNVNEPRTELKPMFKFVANIGGDDAVGYALMVSLMQYLVYSDGADSRITNILDTIDIWIVPTFNPLRLFYLHKKLNRSIVSDIYSKDIDKDISSKPFRYSEIFNLLHFIKQNPFVLSGNMQAGAIVASYPLDYNPNNVSTLTTDNDIFVKLAKDYAELNTMMAPGTACNMSFPGGITSGKHWGKNYSGVQDTNYLLSNCFEITFYLSCIKYPEPSELPRHWDANLESMLKFIENTRQGVYGLVRGNNGDLLDGAVIRVEGRDKEIKVTEKGEYWRLLVPGEYTLTASAFASIPESQTVRVTEEERYVRVDFNLTRQGVYGRVDYVPVSVKRRAVIKVEGEDKETEVMAGGMYFMRLVLNHQYTFSASAYGHINQTKKVLLTESEPYVRLDFVLTAIGVNGRVWDNTAVDRIPRKQNCVNFFMIKGSLEALREDAIVKVIQVRRTGEEKEVEDIMVNKNEIFWTPLDVGHYKLTASAPGYTSDTQTVILSENSRYSEINFLLTRQGVHGRVKDIKGNPIEGAVVQMLGKDKEINVTEHGGYWMPLDLGRYKVTATASGYTKETKTLYVTLGKPYVKQDFVLKTKKHMFPCFGD